MSEDLIGESRLRVAVRAPSHPAHAAAVLGPGRTTWLGSEVDGSPEGMRRYVVDLELRVGDHVPRVEFRKAAFVDVGDLRREDAAERLTLDISWRAASMSLLFPVFAGVLAWQDGELQLDGFYAPPGGRIGEVADHLLLNVAARATGRRLLERIAEQMARPGTSA